MQLIDARMLEEGFRNLNPGIHSPVTAGVKFIQVFPAAVLLAILQPNVVILGVGHLCKFAVKRLPQRQDRGHPFNRRRFQVAVRRIHNQRHRPGFAAVVAPPRLEGKYESALLRAAPEGPIKGTVQVQAVLPVRFAFLANLHLHPVGILRVAVDDHRSIAEDAFFGEIQCHIRQFRRAFLDGEAQARLALVVVQGLAGHPEVIVSGLQVNGGKALERAGFGREVHVPVLHAYGVATFQPVQLGEIPLALVLELIDGEIDHIAPGHTVISQVDRRAVQRAEAFADGHGHRLAKLFPCEIVRLVPVEVVRIVIRSIFGLDHPLAGAPAHHIDV